MKRIRLLSIFLCLGLILSFNTLVFAESDSGMTGSDEDGNGVVVDDGDDIIVDVDSLTTTEENENTETTTEMQNSTEELITIKEDVTLEPIVDKNATTEDTVNIQETKTGKVEQEIEQPVEPTKKSINPMIILGAIMGGIVLISTIIIVIKNKKK